MTIKGDATVATSIFYREYALKSGFTIWNVNYVVFLLNLAETQRAPDKYSCLSTLLGVEHFFYNCIMDLCLLKGLIHNGLGLDGSSSSYQTISKELAFFSCSITFCFLKWACQLKWQGPLNVYFHSFRL